MIYSCNYKIPHTFDTTVSEQIEYTIRVNNQTIYEGVITPFSPDNRLTIDIGEICRSYLETFYENIINNTILTALPVVDNKGSLHTFTVVSDSNVTTPAGETYRVVYDYNTDYEEQLADARYLNAPIDTIVDPRQKLFASGHNPGVSQQYRTLVNGVQSQQATSSASSIIMFPYTGITAAAGSTIEMIMTGIGSTIYNVVPECRNRYALYYVNKFGGLDSLLLSGRYRENWSPQRVDVRLYNDRSNRLDWEQKRIHSEQDHQWELNTGLLSDEGAANIDHLIYSPKIFMHDLTKDTITSCLITDAGYSAKQRPYERPQYTINVKESQKQLRR